MEELPLISVITPSYNQAKYIKETIESVHTQNYPNIEHLVIDGGSTDGTMEILQSYAYLGHRFRYVSESDRGQSHAINKGLAMAKGEVIGWLNSDDTYLPGALRKAAVAFRKNPQWGIVYGKALYINEASQVIKACYVEPFKPNRLFEGCIIAQPAAFLRKEVFTRLGGVEESLQFCMDYDLWIRASKECTLGFIDDYLANSRQHDQCKSIVQWADIGLPEVMETCKRHYGAISNEWIIEYLRNHKQRGPLWMLRQFKALRIFGSSPLIGSMNRYEDLWVPPSFEISFIANALVPLSHLIIEGGHVLPAFVSRQQKQLRFSVFVNGMAHGFYTVDQGAFTLEIPIFSSISKSGQIELVISDSFVPSELQLNPDTRALSCLVEEVVPCTRKEYEFYCVLKNHPEKIEDWIMRSRKPKPHLRAFIKPKRGQMAGR